MTAPQLCLLVGVSAVTALLSLVSEPLVPSACPGSESACLIRSCWIAACSCSSEVCCSSASAGAELEGDPCCCCCTDASSCDDDCDGAEDLLAPSCGTSLRLADKRPASTADCTLSPPSTSMASCTFVLACSIMTAVVALLVERQSLHG